jgi:dihydrofolate synthase / folylpolyglutamate synthase
VTKSPIITSFAEANHYLARFYDNSRTKYTLDTMRRLMDYLGNPQNSYRVVHVAGTSGKTSTAYFAAALLTTAGYKTGLTVSPHVDELNERLQLNMVPLAEADFCRELTEFLQLIEPSGIKPSWFELMVALAYWYFAKVGVDYAVIEVGLGGLMDGTNVMNRADKVCVITDIGLDHVQILGNTLPRIAAQKAGIIGLHNEVFVQRQDPAVLNVIQAAAADKKAQLRIMEPQTEHAPKLLPAFQQRNFQLAEQAVDFVLRRDKSQALSPEQRTQASAVYIPGRMELVHLGDKQLILDGAHNEQKMGAFVRSFEQRYQGIKPAVLVALKEGKDYEAVVPLLAPLASRIIVSTFAGLQDLPTAAMDPVVLAEAFRAHGMMAVAVIADPHAAYEALIAGPEAVLIVTGSFYLLHQIRNNELNDSFNRRP